MQYHSFYNVISMLLQCNIYAFTTAFFNLHRGLPVVSRDVKMTSF